MSSNSAGIGGLLPPQTSSVASYILTTDGQTASWEASSASLPSQGGHSGEFLTTNGTTASWGAVTTLPDQTGNSGKFLTTNGTTASWATVTGVTSGAQTFSGEKTFDSAAHFTGAIVTAAGTNAVQLGNFSGFTGVGGAGGSSGAMTLAFDGATATILVVPSGGKFYFATGWGTYIATLDVASGLDMTGLGNGGTIKLKSPDGTTYTAHIANGGTWSIS